MYLMNVPPVAATHTEWRACGPAGGYSLPICLNDSDTELSTRGTPISDKVQMIIESLRSTQSSLEKGDEMEGTVLSGQEGHPQVCKATIGSFGSSGSNSKGPTENQPATLTSPINQESHDSDSDDSVDRGIEEAILEYLKEKDGHKRKVEPCTTILQPSKIPRRNPLVPEVSTQNTESNNFSITNNQFSRSVKVETPMAPTAFPMKKYIKHKASLHEGTVKNLESKSLELPKEQTKSPSNTISLLNKVTNKLEEEDSDDSSSDDGIEEAIQRYQLEKEQQNRREPLQSYAFREESDSTSDDGIEEAIRCYQLEQLKEKSVLKPFLHKQKQSKSLLNTVGGTTMENVKRHKLKKSRLEKEMTSVMSHPLSVCSPKRTLSDSTKGKGNGLFSFKVEGFQEQPAPAPASLKANTTAELMCAEAILDISKTVMPGGFHHAVGLSSCAPSEPCVQASLPDNDLGGESDDSSIDSEDGIEQEIRKFLEQKAQMHKQPLSSATTSEPCGINELEAVRTKPVPSQKKHRLSLTQKRKQRDENSISNMTVLNDDVKETDLEISPEHTNESHDILSQTSKIQLVSGVCKTEQSGDKSSSLDSDEDLDTAIKDLLKTKKKSKKKIRDLKRKSRKCLKKEVPLLGNALQTKKFKPDLIPKRSSLKKTQKSRDDLRDKTSLSKKNVSSHKQDIKGKGHDMHEGESENWKRTESQGILLMHSTLTRTALQIKEESSSVDSDDSIEQEIRKFLAEKAKVSTAEKNKDEDVSTNGNVTVSTQCKVEDIEPENQLAEIPRKSITSLSGQSPPDSKPPHDKSPLPGSQSLLPDNSISTVGAQSNLSSVQRCSPGLLEPADGAGAARTEQRRPGTGGGNVQDASPEKERARAVLSPNMAQSRSDSIKWRQSLGLPTTDTRTLSRTPFLVTSSKMSDSASGTPFQSGGTNFKLQTPVSVWSAARTSRSPFPCATETNVNATYRSPVFSFLSASRQHPGMSFTQSLTPGFRSQCNMEGETESMVHMPKDKSVFVELETNRTNHVQVRSRDRSEGKDRGELLTEKKREDKSMKIDDKEGHLERAEEEFRDEAECESGSRRNPEKKQGFSTLSLLRAIDPGITFRPCIALTTEERSERFSRKGVTAKGKKRMPWLSGVPVQHTTVESVKRRLQFVPVHRNDTPSQWSMHNTSSSV